MTQLREARRHNVFMLALFSVVRRMRTPTNGVLGMVDLLAGSPLSPEQRAQVNTVRESAELQLSILNTSSTPQKSSPVVCLSNAPRYPQSPPSTKSTKPAAAPPAPRAYLGKSLSPPDVPLVLRRPPPPPSSPRQPRQQRHQIHRRRRGQPRARVARDRRPAHP